ncbi:MAG: hypothetical protein IID40_01725 [Planctomycetes bacterium]|nr:hypothetical protein [Planctomycetota bacterium]
MPLLLSTRELRANMRLADAVTHGTKELMPAGLVLSAADVDALRRDHPQLMIRVTDPALDEMGVFADDTHDREVARSARQALATTLSGVRKRFAAQMSLNQLDFRGLQEAVADVVQYIRDNPVAAAILADHAESDHYLTEHSANVFYLALVLGNAVRGYVQRAQAQNSARRIRVSAPPLDLTPLALAALFQDVSLWSIEELYRTGAPLTPQQWKTVRQHPLTGAEMLPDDMPAATPTAVAMHHENIDGSGYPRGLTGDDLPVFPRILRICDAFDAGTATRVYAQAKSPARILGEMTRGPYRQFYDPLLLKVFSHLVQPYPIGAKLRLNCRRHGVVVRYGQVDPFLPTIVIAFDRDGQRLPPGRVEGPFALDRHPEIRIESFGADDLTDLYNAPADQSEPLVVHEFSNLFESSYP